MGSIDLCVHPSTGIAPPGPMPMTTGDGEMTKSGGAGSKPINKRHRCIVLEQASVNSDDYLYLFVSICNNGLLEMI